MLKGHGDDRYLYQEPIRADFSSNVRTEHFPKEMPEILQEGMESILRYPEPQGESLRSRLAEIHGVGEDEVLVTNGSTEAFYMIAAAFDAGTATIPAPTFAEYADACKAHGWKVRRPYWDQLGETDAQGQLIFLCNPNSPTGKARSPGTLLEILEKASLSLAVIDESNLELTPEPVSLLPHFTGQDDRIIVRSLTKSFGIPGLRIGYLIARKDLLEGIKKVKMPWSVNSLALRAGEHLVDRYGARIGDKRKRELHKRSEELRGRIDALEAFETVPSESSYFLVRLKEGKAAELKGQLIREHGILIRDASNFEGLDERYFRLSVQDPPSNDRLIEALKEWERG